MSGHLCFGKLRKDGGEVFFAERRNHILLNRHPSAKGLLASLRAPHAIEPCLRLLSSGRVLKMQREDQQRLIDGGQDQQRLLPCRQGSAGAMSTRLLKDQRFYHKPIVHGCGNPRPLVLFAGMLGMCLNWRSHCRCFLAASEVNKSSGLHNDSQIRSGTKSMEVCL